MAEVGVLELTIQDNSEQAAGGLTDLTGALTAIKNAVGKGLGLGTASRQIKTLAENVAGSSKALNSIGNLLTALRQYSEAFKDANKLTFNAEPIKQLKAAIGEGFKIGNAGTQLTNIRDALAGEWSTEGTSKAAITLNVLANAAGNLTANNASTAIKNVTKSMKDLIEVSNQAGRSGGAHDFMMQVFSSAGEGAANTIGTDYANIGRFAAEGMNRGVESCMSAIKETGKRMGDVMAGGTEETLEENSPSKRMRRDGRFAGEGMALGAHDSLAEVRRAGQELADGLLMSSKSELQAINSQSEQLNATFGSIARSSADVSRFLSDPITTLRERFMMCNDEATRLNGVMNVTIPSMSSLGVETSRAAQAFNATGVRQFTIELREVGDTISSVVVPNLMAMWQTWSMMAYEFNMFANTATRLMSGDSFLRLGDGKTPGQLLLGDGNDPEIFLSTWVQTGEQWKTNWIEWTSDVAEQWRAMWSPDWILGGWNTVPSNMQHLLLGQGETRLRLGDGGVAPENALSTHVDYQEQWKPDWSDGSDWKPDWIVGDGVVREAAEDLQAATEQAGNFAAAMENAGNAAAGQADTFNEALEFARQWNAHQPVDNQAMANAREDMAWIDDLVNNASAIDLLNMRIDSMRDRLYEGATTGNMTGEQIARLIEQIQRAQEEVRELTRSSTGLIGAWNGLRGVIGRLFPTLTGVISQFGRMARSRAIRYVVRQIASGFSEGVQNVYQYSKAINSSFAPAMDAAATSLQQMKNSIGAAVAPLIQAMIPALQSVISWLIEGINFLNQFFALLNGQSTWTRALPEQAEAFEKTKKATKGAGKAVKDLLADWDELNIIQSNSNNTGTGGTAKTAAEYKNMFEEVSEFSDEVKNVMSFIEEHLGGLSGLLKKLGVLILGWKFSRAFQNVLGQIGQIIAGGALLVIGVELSYGGGFSAGVKGFFDGGDLIASIGGTLASAIGGSLISTGLGLGPGIGFAIGLGAGIVMTLYGYIKGQEDAADAVKWGNLHKTQEEVEEYVRKQFSFDITAESKVLHANVEFLQDAKDEADAAIEQFENDLRQAEIDVKLGVDSSPAGTNVRNALISAQMAITSLQGLIDQTNKGIEIGMSILPPTDDNGQNVSEDVLAGIKIAEEPIRDYMYKMGEELSKAMYDGEKAGWENGTTEAALSLMKEQQAVFDKAKQYKTELDLQSSLKGATKDVVKDGVFDRETALAALAFQEEQLNEFRTNAMAEAEAEADNLRYLAAFAQAAAESEFSKGHIEAGSDLERSAKELMEQAEQKVENRKKEIDEKLRESKETIAKDWAELIQTVYGGDIDKSVMNSTTPLIDTAFSWLTGQTESAYKQSLKHAENKGEFIRAWLEGEFSGFDKNGVIPQLVNEVGLNLWDLLSEGAKKNLFINTADVLHSSDKARKAIMAAFGLSYEDIMPYVENYREYVDEAVENAAKESESGIGFFGLSYKAPKVDQTEYETGLDQMVETAEEAVEEINETLLTLEDGKIHIEPDMGLSNDTQTYIRMIENAVNSGKGMDEIKAALAQGQEMFGLDAYLDALPYINMLIEKYREINEVQQPETTGAIRPLRTSAMGGASSVGYAAGSTMVQGGSVATEPVNNEQDVDNTARGVERGNMELLSAINSLLEVARAISNKEFKVVVAPTSGWGQHNSKSSSMWNFVTGDIP